MQKGFLKKIVSTTNIGKIITGNKTGRVGDLSPMLTKPFPTTYSSVGQILTPSTGLGNTGINPKAVQTTAFGDRIKGWVDKIDDILDPEVTTSVDNKSIINIGIMLVLAVLAAKFIFKIRF